MKFDNEQNSDVESDDDSLDCPYHHPFQPQSYGQLQVPLTNDNDSGIDVINENQHPFQSYIDLYNQRQSDTSDSDTETEDDDDDDFKWTPSSSPLTITYGVEDDFNETFDEDEMQELMNVLDRIMRKKTKLQDDSSSASDVEGNKLGTYDTEVENDELEWEFGYFLQEDSNEEDAAN